MNDLIRLFRFLKGYVAVLVLSLVLLLLSTLLNLLQPRLIEWVVDRGIAVSELRILALGAAGIFLTACVGGGLQYASGILLVKAGQGMSYGIRNALYRKIMSFSFENLDRRRTGELMVRLNSDAHNIGMFIRMGFLMIVHSVIMLAGSLVIMFLMNARLALVMGIVMPLMLSFFFIAAALVRPVFLKVRRTLDEVNNVLQENLAGAKVVRAFARQEYEMKRFGEKNEAYLRLSLKVGYIISVLFPLLFFLGNLTIVLLMWRGGMNVIAGSLLPGGSELTLGQLLAFNTYAMLATWPILALGMVLNFVSMASASASRIEEVLLEEPSVTDPPGGITVPALRGEIEFDAVSFSYGGGENAVNRVSLRIRAGEKIGILGMTGSGKSSLVHLVPRFYDPQEGEVRIDGTDVRRFALSTLRRRISLVLQETVLLSGSIRENILYGNPEAGAEVMERAARAACAEEFVMDRDGRWDELVGERGTGLSGGQRQRIAIARAVAADPDILILDDATSSVDATTERKIVANLYREFAGRTVLIISQKISSIAQADRIVLLENGAVAGEGTHEELLAGNETYREIHRTQSAEIRT